MAGQAALAPTAPLSPLHFLQENVEGSQTGVDAGQVALVTHSAQVAFGAQIVERQIVGPVVVLHAPEPLRRPHLLSASHTPETQARAP